MSSIYSLSHRPKWLIPTAILAGALLTVAYVFRPLNVTFGYDIRTPKVPSPNAHDMYLAAARSIRTAPIDEVLDERARDDQRTKVYPLSAKLAWLKDNQRGFAYIKAAQKTPYLYPPIRHALLGGDIVPAYELRALANYKTVESHALGEQGRHAKAVNSALDIWQMGIDAAQGAPLTPTLNALAVEIRARLALSSEIAHLNGTQASQAARRLEKLLSKRVPYVEILTEERNATLFQQKVLYEKAVYQARQEAEMEERLERGETTFYSNSGLIPKLNGPLVNYQVRKKASEYAKGMNALISHADQSWPQRASTPFPLQLEPRTISLLRVVAKSRFYYTRADAAGQLSLARLALHAYRKDKGVYPATLAALAPKYLDAVPRDPFSESQTLCYKRQGKRYKLWSVGPDTQDNGGQPIENPMARTPEGRYLVANDSRGDVVANINQ